MSKTLGKWRGNALLAAAFVGLPLNALAADILYSLQSDRSNSINLDQGNFSPESSLYIFLGVESNAGINNVQFFLDDPDRLGSPFQREGLFPYDFRGGSNAAANSFNLSQLSAGPHTITSQTTFSDGSLDIVTASFTIDTSTENPDRDGDGVLNIDDIFPDDALEWADLDADGIGDNSDPDIDGDGIENSADDFPTDPTRFEAPNYEIGFSFSPDRSASMPLNAAQFEGTENIYTFLDVPANNDVTRVYFYVNSPDLSGQWLQSEGLYPYDLRGGATNAANPFDTATLAEGDNTISARVLLDDGTTIETHATFTIAAFEPDSDGDGVPDNIDQCPNTPLSETADSIGCSQFQIDEDGDGVSNALDLCPLTEPKALTDQNGCSSSQRDTDGDGISDGEDAFPSDPTETLDSDGDGIGNNADLDDDNDGVSDLNDAFPLDESEQYDSDNDGYGDNLDKYPSFKSNIATINIDSPNEITIQYGTKLVFQATAIDQMDGDISERIQWESDLTGAFTPEIITNEYTLSPGEHAIVAIAEDGNGSPVSSHVKVIVQNHDSSELRVVPAAVSITDATKDGVFFVGHSKSPSNKPIIFGNAHSGIDSNFNAEGNYHFRIADNGDVVGNDNDQAILISKNVKINLEHASQLKESYALGISNNGEHISGASRTTDFTYQAAYWNRDGALSLIGQAGNYPYTFAKSISEDGNRIESPRVCRRLTFLRELAYEQETYLLPRNA